MVLRVSAESPSDADLMVGDANGDSAIEEKTLLAVGVPNTEVLAAFSDTFSAVPGVVEELEAKEAKPPADTEALGVFSSVVDVTGAVPNAAGDSTANALNPPPDDFEILAAPKLDVKVVGVLDAKALKAPPESLLLSALLLASNAEPKVVGDPDANALNPLAVPELAALISGEPKADVFAGAGGFPKVAGVLAKAANPLAELDGVVPKLCFPKAGCPNEDFPKAGDANPD